MSAMCLEGPRPPAHLTNWLEIQGFSPSKKKKRKKFRASHSSFRFDNWRNDSGLRKMLSSLLQFYYKRYKSGPAKWREKHRVRSGRVPNIELPCPLPMEPGHLTLLAHWYVHQPGSSSKVRCPEILLVFYYIDMVDRLIGHMIELHIQASFPLWREGNVIPRRWGGPALIRWLKAPTL